MAEEDPTKIAETWEIQIPGTVRVLKLDRRTGTYVQTRVSGTKGPKVLQISKDERLYNQERIDPDNAHLDPFQNGALAQRKGGELIGITEEDLRSMLEVLGSEFDELVATIDNELTARRLYDLACKEGRMDQVNALRDHIDDHWKVGGTQPSVGAMFEENLAGERVT